MSGIILHNYPQSPVAEKVRVALGIKGLDWQSVEIPRLPPKPDLVPLTGGYRRTPVMQIGADIYCDSQCILRELERRYPEPTLFPGGADGLAWGASRWTDGSLFDAAVTLVLAAAGNALPQDFAADRGRLYLGPDWAEGLRRAHADLPHHVAQVRAQFGWIDARIAAGRRFLLGDEPGLPDALAYHVVWFIHGRWAGGPALLSEFPDLQAWEQRVRDIGHGRWTDLSAAAALDIARDSAPFCAARIDEQDPQGLKPGQPVTVAPDVDSEETPIAGIVHGSSRDHIAIKRDDPRVGTVCVHFPRVGYRVTPQG